LGRPIQQIRQKRKNDDTEGKGNKRRDLRRGTTYTQVNTKKQDVDGIYCAINHFTRRVDKDVD
jgi:hypothetical protein